MALLQSKGIDFPNCCASSRLLTIAARGQEHQQAFAAAESGTALGVEDEATGIFGTVFRRLPLRKTREKENLGSGSRSG